MRRDRVERVAAKCPRPGPATVTSCDLLCRSYYAPDAASQKKVLTREHNLDAATIPTNPRLMGGYCQSRLACLGGDSPAGEDKGLGMHIASWSQKPDGEEKHMHHVMVIVDSPIGW